MFRKVGRSGLVRFNVFRFVELTAVWTLIRVVKPVLAEALVTEAVATSIDPE